MLLNETVPQWVIDITVDVSIDAALFLHLNMLPPFFSFSLHVSTSVSSFFPLTSFQLVHVPPFLVFHSSSVTSPLTLITARYETKQEQPQFQRKVEALIYKHHKPKYFIRNRTQKTSCLK